MGFGWKNSLRTGKGIDAITSGLEGAWTPTPTKWDNSTNVHACHMNNESILSLQTHSLTWSVFCPSVPIAGYFSVLLSNEWEQVKSPGGATQWNPKGGALGDAVPDAHDSTKKHAPVMFTTDLALKEDPLYAVISKRFHENPDQFEDAFARAWYKLTHRDMGPVSRLFGPEVAPPQLWQDPIPEWTSKLVKEKHVKALKAKILDSGLSIPQLVSTAWASASTFRCTDKRGGANGARVRLAPQKDWPANAGTGPWLHFPLLATQSFASNSQRTCFSRS
jgi:catalase-peroxidase